jgi:peptidoglycan/LPS O-acetylase OafA/YrhL
MTAISDHADFRRNRSLDGVRGCLALVVFVYHVIPSVPLLILSNAAVGGFFVLSGLVLTWSWDGRYVTFLARRFVRLWPLYALCLAVGYGMSGYPPVFSEFFWWPLMSPNDPMPVDPPAWSLCIEAWAMLAMPLFVWCGRGSLKRAGLGALVCVLFAVLIAPQSILGVAFIAGAWASRFRFRLAFFEHPLVQWLGKISYPLYLSHWLVLNYMPGPMIVRVSAALAVAQVLTLTIERWSIAASRAVTLSRDALPIPRQAPIAVRHLAIEP